MNASPTHRRGLCALAISVAIAGGCADMSPRERGTAQGAGIGAAAGAILGGATGNHVGTGAVIGGALGAVAGNLWSQRMEERRLALEQSTRGTDVEVSRTADNQLKVAVPNDVSFATGSAAIRPQLRDVFDPFAASLRDDPNAYVNIIGHTDSTGPESINDPLSLERARSVRDYLVDRGVPASHIQVAGRGEREPVADNATEAGRARNRRVEIFLREAAG